MKISKPKMILSQLGTDELIANVPLASGYLKSMAYKASLLKNVDIEILNNILSSFVSDYKLILYILERQPFCIGFSCYVWNMERTIYIINQIKKRTKKVKVICGGCEVSSQYNNFIRNENIDIIVRGEGELTFTELLKNFLFNMPKLENINGIVFRKKGKIIVTSPREQIPDINIIPSPYLLGFIDPKEYEEVMMETYRGCVQKCTYCNWSRNYQGIRYFSIGRIRNEIALARKKGVTCDIIDSIFNLPKNLLRLYKVIKKFNRDKCLNLAVEAQAEYINEKTINLLSQCKIGSVGIGLQSTNPTALANVNRYFNKKLFVRGLKLLKKKKILYRLDMIIGLPGDTIYAILKTIRFALKHSFQKFFYFEILRVQPGTELRRQAKKFNLKYLKKSPYFVLSTNALSHIQLKKLSTIWQPLERYNKNFKKQFAAPRFLYFQQDYYIKKSIDVLKLHDKKNLIISNLVFNVNNSNHSIKQVKSLAVCVSRFISFDSQILLKNVQFDHNFHLILEFLHQISKRTPFSKFSIFIENDDFFNSKILYKLHEVIVHKPSYNERKEKFYADLQNVKRKFYKCKIGILQLFSRKSLFNIKEISSDALIIWKVPILESNNWRVLLREVLNAPYGNLLIKFVPNYNNPHFIADVLKYIFKFRVRKKNVFFSDYAVQLFYQEILINKRSLQEVIKNFVRPSQIVYVGVNFRKTLWEYDISGCTLKLNNINNACKWNIK